MSGDTALILSLTYGVDAGNRIAGLASTHAKHLPEQPWEAAWILKLLASPTIGMPGSSAGVSVIGTVSKSPDTSSIAAALAPFLLDLFRECPDGRAILWNEAYEAGDDGANVTEIFMADEETEPTLAEPRLATREHSVDFGIRGYSEPTGAESPPSPSRACDARSLVLMFECDDEGLLAERARTAAALLRQSSASATTTRALVLDYLDQMASRASTTEYVGPKGGLSVWGRAGVAFDAVELVRLAEPFFREITDEMSGLVLLYQTAEQEAGACRVGTFDPDDGSDPEFMVRYHDLPFGLTWAPALLVR